MRGRSYTPSPPRGYGRRGRSYTPSPPRGYGRRGRSPPRGRYGRGDEPTSLLVRNLRHDCRPEDLRRPFSQFGPVKDIYLPRDYYTNEPRGFGFVQYVDPADAADAKYEMDGRIFQGRELTVVFAEENRKKPTEMRARERGRSRVYDRSPRYSRTPRYSRSPSPRYGRAPSRSHDYYFPPPERKYSRSISPRERMYSRERSYSLPRSRSQIPEKLRSPYGSGSCSQSPSRGDSPVRSRSPSYSRSRSPSYSRSRSPSYSRSRSPSYSRSRSPSYSRSRSPSYSRSRSPFAGGDGSPSH